MLGRNKAILLPLIANLICSSQLYATEAPAAPEPVQSPSGQTQATPENQKQPPATSTAETKRPAPSTPSMVDYCRENTC